MGYLVPIAELGERIGAGTADFRDNIAEGVRDFSCTLWSNFPDQITQNNNLGTSFIRGYMNDTCKDKTLPSPPVPPFSGGQCTFNYDIFYRYGNPGQLPSLNSGTTICSFQGLPGAIASISTNEVGSTGFMTIVDGNGTQHDCSGAYIPGRLTGVFLQPSSGFDTDNCGDPPPQYPITNPTVNDYQTTININSQDGDTLTYDLEYSPIDFNFPLNFNLGGIKIIFDLGGINFNFSLVSIDGLPIPLPGGGESPIPAPQDDGNRNIRPRKRPPPNADNYNEDEKTETDPKEEDIGDILEFVRVTLTSVPTNVKGQWGDGAPDVIYAGWFEFQGEGYNFPRQPIHFTNSLFATPEGATGYAYTLYEGITGKATVYTFKEEV